MKKICLMVMMLALTFALFGQWVNSSLEGAVTGGMFSNDIDNAFNASPDFGKYDQRFIWGGLGNPYAATLKDNDKPWEGFNFGNANAWFGANSDYSLTAFDEKKPMQFGYYTPGKLPMSFYGAFGARNPITPNKPTTVYTYDTNDHTKVTKITKNSHTYNPLFRDWSFAAQYLIAFGSGKKNTSGVYFYLKGNNTNYAQANFIKTVFIDKEDAKNNETTSLNNITAGAPAVPTALTWKNIPKAAAAEFTRKFLIGVPFAFSTGSMDHTASLEIGSEVKTTNGSYYHKKEGKSTYHRVNNFTSTTDLNLNYKLEMPAKSAEEDLWIIGAKLGFSFGASHSGWSYKTNEGGKNIKSTSSTYNRPGLGFTLGLMGGRQFVFTSPKKTYSFKFQPTLGMNLYTGMAKKDSLAGGSYDETKKINVTIDGDKYSYKKTTRGGNHKNYTELDLNVAVPMGLKVLPENWKIGFLLGAVPAANLKVTAEWDRSGIHKTPKEKEITSIPGSTTTNETGGDHYPGLNYTSGTTSLTYAWRFTETHMIGFTIPFEGGAHLDFVLNGANITDFEKFVIQAFIPLGAPKAK